jgi:hypothetical protein
MAFYRRPPRCLRRQEGGGRPRAAVQGGGAGSAGRRGPVRRARHGRHAAGRGLQGHSRCVWPRHARLGMRSALGDPDDEGGRMPRGSTCVQAGAPGAGAQRDVAHSIPFSHVRLRKTLQI